MADKTFTQFVAIWLIQTPNKDLLVTRSPDEASGFLALVYYGHVTKAEGRRVFNIWVETGEWEAFEFATATVDLAKPIAEALSENKGLVDRYKAGETKLLGPLAGAVTKKVGSGVSFDQVKEELLKALA